MVIHVCLFHRIPSLSSHSIRESMITLLRSCIQTPSTPTPPHPSPANVNSHTHTERERERERERGNIVKIMRRQEVKQSDCLQSAVLTKFDMSRSETNLLVAAVLWILEEIYTLVCTFSLLYFFLISWCKEIL